MRTEREVRERLDILREYHDAGWIPDEGFFSYAENELLWMLGEVGD